MHTLELAEIKDDDFPETMTIDISEEDIKALRVGQRIEIVIKGSVGMLQIPPEGTSDGGPPMMGVRVSSKTVSKKNVFADLAEEDDGDESEEK